MWNPVRSINSHFCHLLSQDDEDDREALTPHTITDNHKIRVSSGQPEDPSVVLAKMEQLMRSNMQVQFASCTCASPAFIRLIMSSQSFTADNVSNDRPHSL